jgi:signal transduction histidine kinase
VLALFQTELLTPLTPLVTPLVLALLPAYAVAAYARTAARAIVGLATCLAGGLLLELAGPRSSRGLSETLPVAALVLVAWLSGRAVAARTRRLRELQRLERALLETGDARERLAVAEQRAHVARELHDIVAHSMTVICLQAAGAQRIWWQEPAQARDALAAVTGAARDALAHLRDALDLLDEDGPDTRIGLHDLEALARGARVAGLNVAVRVDGPPHALPGAVALVAFRIVQESLTNAIRHAAPTDVVVSLAYEADALAIDVRDAGRPPGIADAVVVAGSGNGLRGMRERVDSLAGAISFGPLPAGGFGVHACLPLEPRS